jgi:hypothetical protein
MTLPVIFTFSLYWKQPSKIIQYLSTPEGLNPNVRLAKRVDIGDTPAHNPGGVERKVQDLSTWALTA